MPCLTKEKIDILSVPLADIWRISVGVWGVVIPVEPHHYDLYILIVVNI